MVVSCRTLHMSAKTQPKRLVDQMSWLLTFLQSDVVPATYQELKPPSYVQYVQYWIQTAQSMAPARSDQTALHRIRKQAKLELA